MRDAVCQTRPGEASDAVGGVVPANVAFPATVEEAAAVMRVAADRGLRVLPRGGGTTLPYGPVPSGCDLIIDMTRMDGLLEHAAGDLICRVQAGATLQQVQEKLAPAGQQLALDATAPGSTVGGAVATSASGPLRLHYGTPRDLLIGVTVVRADGIVARSGGKVVKNVAGYDLGKLYTGSYGTLGLIVEAAFRLHPVPPARSFVIAAASGAEAAYNSVRTVLGAQLMPTAIEIDRPVPGSPVTIGVLVDGDAAGVAQRAQQAGHLVGGDADVSEAPPAWWASPLDGVRIKLTAEIAALPGVLEAIDAAGDRAGVRTSVRGSAGSGVLAVGLPGDASPATIAEFLHQLRPMLAVHGGTAVLRSAPGGIPAAVDAWGPVSGLELMHRVKDQFDPQHRLSPGRFVGGI